MEKLETEMREIVKKFLNEGKVDLVIGYQKGSLPLRTTPAFIRKAEDADKLVWNSYCDLNLVKFLLKPEIKDKKVGIIVKGCDARSLVVILTEGQIERDKVTIIGMPCSGMIDRKKIESEIAPKEIVEAKVTNGEIDLKGPALVATLAEAKYYQTSCQVCQYNNPPVCDVLVGGQPIELNIKPDEDWDAVLGVLDANSPDEKWKYFTEILKDCIKCYGCRNACPLCYCKECFVDQTQPLWCGKTTNLSDIVFYHLIRAFHVAGRCVGCGACTRACPMGIDLRLLSKKLAKIVKERYDFVTGLDLEKPAPMATYTTEDAEEFITEPE